MISFEFLKKVKIFDDLNDDQLSDVMGCCQEKEYHHGDRLFGEGDDAIHMWVVMDGQVDLRFDLPGRPTSEENNISSISAYNTFGWSSLVPPYKYGLSAYCATRSCKVLKVEKECLTNLFEEDTLIGYRVMSNLAAVVGERFDQLQDSTLPAPFAKVKISVHMATCGIVAGAREVMTALMDEMARLGQKNIEVVSSGCLGMCNSEPNVTIEIQGEEPVIYQKMNADKMRQVFNSHVLKGKILSDFVITK